MRVIDRVRRFVQQHGLIRPESRVVLAVSGGSDSVAMLQVCRELSRSGDLKIAGIAHFNHQLRANANEHERFVAEAAVECDLPFVSDRENVGAIAAREHRSIEDAGRRARYAFYERARVALEGDLVAVGHTRDDQAETFLLRLTRGAGPRGLAGMHPRTGRIVRPLLDCGRAELREWLVKSAERGGVGCRFVEDETNEDVSIPRNRVRHELLPLLATRFNPAIVEVLARESVLLQDVWAWMEEASVSCFETPGVLSVERLRRMPAGLQRLIVWRALRDAGDREITADHVASVIRLIREESGNQEKGVDVPGQRVQRIAGRIVLTNRLGSGNSPGSRGSNRENPENQFRYPLSIPGKVFIAETDLILSAEQGGPTSGFEPGGRATTGKGAEALVRRDLICGSLAVRNRRPGDRFHPVGLGGSKKIQDLFVDRKLARAERDQVPLVVDGGDRIIWVAGYGIDDAFRVTDPSQAVLVLRLTRASHGGAPECFGGSA